MKKLVDLASQLEAQIRVKGYIGLRQGEPFTHTGIYFDSGRYIKAEQFRYVTRNAAREAGFRQWDSDRHGYVTMETDTSNGRITLTAHVVPPGDGPETETLVYTLLPEAVEEILRLLRLAEVCLDSYDHGLVRELADRELSVATSFPTKPGTSHVDTPSLELLAANG
jgi:hypothetical protein